MNLLTKAGRRFDQFTYIEQKRVELARALATRPRVLLLDEWLSGLSPSELEGGMSVVWSLAAQGMAVILVEHVMTAVRELCHRVVVMNAGAKIAEGLPGAVLRDAGSHARLSGRRRCLRSADGLDHAYGRHRALHDVSIRVRAGEVVAILGANGAGKTTLLNAVAGLMRPSGRLDPLSAATN